MTPDWTNSPIAYTRTNAWFVIRNAFFMMVFPTMAVLNLFEEHPDKILLFMGAFLFFLGYELTTRSYTRVRCLEGCLEFSGPLRTYSLLPGKKTQCLVLHPDELTDVDCFEHKRTKTYYFRKKQQALAFVTISGMSRLENDLRDLFPERVNPGFHGEFPLEEKRRLEQEDAERVF